MLFYLKTNFQITVDEANEFVGMEIKRDRAKRTIKISQPNYVTKIIEKFGMSDAYAVSVSAEPGICLNKNVKVCEKSESIPYREAVGSLLFAARVCRPDI